MGQGLTEEERAMLWTSMSLQSSSQIPMWFQQELMPTASVGLGLESLEKMQN